MKIKKKIQKKPATRTTAQMNYPKLVSRKIKEEPREGKMRELHQPTHHEDKLKEKEPSGFQGRKILQESKPEEPKAQAKQPEIISSSYLTDGGILFERLADASVRICSTNKDFSFSVVISEAAWQSAKSF